MILPVTKTSEESKVGNENEVKKEKEADPYTFEFSPCQSEGQFLIKVKFTKNIPLDEEPTIYYRRMIDIITATLLKDAILNVYNVRLEYREDYDSKYSKHSPFFIFKLYDAGKDKFVMIREKLLKKEFIENKFFTISSTSCRSLPTETLINDFHRHTRVFYGDDIFEVDGFCFKDDSVKDGPGFNLKEPSEMLISYLDFCFRFHFKYVRLDAINKGERYSYLLLFFYGRDILLADCAALLMMNISLDEYRSVYKISLNYPHKAIRQVTYPYKVYDYTEIPVCITYASSDKEREVVRQERLIHNGACVYIDNRLKDKYGLLMMHIYPCHELHDGFWYLYYKVYVPYISDELAKEIQEDLESYRYYSESAWGNKKFIDVLLVDFYRCNKFSHLFFLDVPTIYFMICPTQGNLIRVDLKPKKNRMEKKKTFLIKNEIEINSDPILIKQKNDYDDERCDLCVARIKIKGSVYVAMRDIEFLGNEKFKIFINENTRQKFLNVLFFFKGEDDQLMTFIEALNVLGEKAEMIFIYPAKAKIIRPRERVSFFRKLLDNSDYADSNEKIIIQTCLDLAKRRDEEQGRMAIDCLSRTIRKVDTKKSKRSNSGY